MAAKWNLVCTSCLRALPIGRLVTIDDSGAPVDPRWDGFQNGWDQRWVSGSELLNTIGRFLAVHLGHNLATLATDAILASLEPFEVDAEPLTWVENVEDILQEDIHHPQNGMETDAAKELSRRLESLES